VEKHRNDCRPTVVEAVRFESDKIPVWGIQLINGMQEIKVHNAEKYKRWQWERIQSQLFKVNLSSLTLDQWQRGGASFINEFKNILITFIAAKAVIDNEMTLGMMLAVQYIIGQLNAPLEQLFTLIQQAQDAKISLERLNEIHLRENEEKEESLNVLPDDGSLYVDKVSFRYGGPHSPLVINNITLRIPEGKTTAIVGTSGSGKTTLLKLLLNFYSPTGGEIRVGGVNLNSIQHRIWREQCGVVMQEGFIFSDTIARNIAFGEEQVDKKKLLRAVKIANIQGFIDQLPLGYNTMIGEDGIGLSQGQKQRILIARAVYKNPKYVFFDEATNALDAFNEMVIMENLEEFLQYKTVVVVAHRLSTVRSADNIIVMEKGEIIESGTHEELTRTRGAYFHLVKNQLELGA
jgi:ATP-binding cassette subfamily B protein